MSRHHRRLLIALNLALAAAVALLLAFSVGMFTTWQVQSSDFLFKARATEPSTRVGIVAVDDRSLRELADQGRVFNWPRSLYAQVVASLMRAGARVVVLDMLFDAPSADDDALAATISSANVVLPVAGEMPSIGKSGEVAGYDLLVAPVPKLAQAAALLGHVNVDPDGDGTVRRQQLAIASQGQEYPSLALAAAARYLRRPSIDLARRDDALFFAGRSIPIADARRGMVVNYFGAPYQPNRPSVFPVVSFVDVLRGRADLVALKDRVVLIGVVATGYADDYWTPPSIGRKMSGVEIHANTVETILRPAPLRTVSATGTNLVILLFALIAGLASMRFRSLPAGAIAFAIMLCYLLLAFVLFDRGILVNLFYPMLAPPLSFAIVMAYRVRFVESDQRATRRLLSGYLSPTVVAEVLKEPEKLRLGGQKRTMTVLFSDIRGFTTYSEQMDPEQLVSLLNEYLSEMSAVIFKHEGVVDKYIGDGVMAFWGAPVDQEDQSRRGCLAALDMMRRLKALNERWGGAGIPAFDIGIGVHTGPMAVGNMGSLERFSYTVIGDAVNLGARLESLNKQYGTNIIVSDAVLNRAGEGFTSRFLDRVAVKGKRDPVAVFQLLSDVTTESELSQRSDLLRGYSQAMRLAGEGRWQEAADIFQHNVERWPGDGPSAFHLKRCLEMAAKHGDAEWDGVYVAQTK